MKHILAPILLMVFLFPSLALGEEITMDDLVWREGIFYKKSTDVPFTGKVTGLIQGSVKDGVPEGPWITYHNTGQLMKKGNYKNGLREGTWVLLETDGTVYERGTYKNGVKVD